MEKNRYRMQGYIFGTYSRGATPVAIDRILASAFGVFAVDLIAKKIF